MAVLTGAVLGLTLHYTSTLTVECLHQLLLPSALSPHKRDSEDVVTKPKLEDQLQYYPYGVFEGEAALGGPIPTHDSFAEWNSRKDMMSLGGTQLSSMTILEEDEYSEDSTGY